MNKTAVIDLGTNTFHLLIGSCRNGQLHISAQEKVAVKIGKGGINQGIITHEAMQRAVACLRSFKEVIDRHRVQNVLAFGTSALRSALNAPELVARIANETGFQIQIISGEREAELIYAGVRAAVPLGDQPNLIVDIGGGSVEFIIANRTEVFWEVSLEIGGQRLLEMFQKHDPILADEIARLHLYLDAALQPVWGALARYQPETLVGSSGTFDTLSEMYCASKGIPYPAHVPQTPLTWEYFSEAFNDLVARNRAERLALPGMIELRVDMIVVACCLIRFLYLHHRFRDIKVSTYSLKEGAMLSAIS